MSENAIEARLAGRLEEAERAKQDEHLAGCRMCRDWVAVLAASTDGAAASQASGCKLEAGSRLGRYELQQELGRGGMGVVVRARDPELGRSVAIKVLHDRFRHTAGRRLVREARALAQLDHPNVVIVHDVGVFEDRVFIAMELVEGTTLRRWLDGDQSREDILSAFAAAGRGLHAAHGAGIVHRDFKPDNVLVGDDGRVKVTDFGLAASQAPSRRPVASGDTVDDDDDDPSRSVLTATGELVGTPRYMAPEQYEARPVDARTDQFSFCVALFEALTKSRPFVGDSLAQLSRNVVEGRIRTDAVLPRGLRKIVLRGLEVDPKRRWPDMAALVTALERELPSARRRRRAVVAMSLVTVAAVGGAYRLGRAPSSTCTESTLGLDDVYDRSVAEQFVGDEPSVAYLQQRLDAWSDAWVQRKVQSCEATHVRHEQGLETLEQQTRCLDRARTQFEQTLALATTPRGVEDAVEAARDLPAPSSCAEPWAGQDTAAAEHRDAVRDGEVLIDQARTLLAAGRSQDAEPLLLAAAAVAERADSHRLRGQARDGLGRVAKGRGQHRRAEVELRAGLASSLRVQDDSGAMRTSIALAGTLISLHDLSAAQLLVDQVDAQLAAAADRGTDRDRVALLVVRQRLARTLGDLEASASLAQQARELADRGTDEILRIETMHGMGVEHSHRRQLAEALELTEKARAEYERLLGPHHRRTLHAKVNAAGIRTKQGDLDAAEALLVEVLDVVPDDSADRFNALQQLARIHDARGEHEPSLEKLDTAIVLASRKLGAKHPTVASISNDRGTTLFYLGRFDEAVAEFENVVRIKEAAYGPEHPSVAASLQNLANLLDEQKRFDEAVSVLERARAISLATRGDHAEHAEVLYALGNVAKHARRIEDARRYFRQAYDHHRARVTVGDPTTAFMALALAEVLLYETAPEDPDFAEGRALLQQAAVNLEGKVRPAVLARSAMLQSQAAEKAGDLEDARQNIEHALDLAKGTPGPEGDAMRGDLEAYAKKLGSR